MWEGLVDGSDLKWEGLGIGFDIEVTWDWRDLMWEGLDVGVT